MVKERQIHLKGEDLPPENILVEVCKKIYKNIESIEISFYEKKQIEQADIYIRQEEFIMGYAESNFMRKLDEYDENHKISDFDSWENNL